MSEAKERSPVFEVEAGSIEEFFRLLELREGQRAHGALLQVEPIPRRAVFIDQLHTTATMERSAGCRWWSLEGHHAREALEPTRGRRRSDEP